MAQSKKKKTDETVEALGVKESADTEGTGGASSEKSSESYTYMAQQLLDKIISQTDAYSYDMNVDPLYKQYSEMYRNEGALAAKDIFGLSSALTGGYGNSYASSLASSVMNQYADKLQSKAQELQQADYEKHRDSISDMRSLYEAYSDMADKAYEKERDEINDSKDEQKSKLEFALEAASMGDFGYLEELGMDVTALRRNDAYDSAAFRAQYGDYSGLRELGIDISKLLKNELNQQAELFAKYGDYSVLKELGVDIAQLKADEKRELAELFAKYGDYSGLEALGADVSDRETQDYYDRLLTYARYLKALR